MSKDPAQLEMFSLEGEGKKRRRKKESLPLQSSITISRRVLLYILVGMIIFLVVVYVAGVEQGRRWKIDKIYKEYIRGQEIQRE